MTRLAYPLKQSRIAETTQETKKIVLQLISVLLFPIRFRLFSSLISLNLCANLFPSFPSIALFCSLSNFPRLGIHYALSISSSSTVSPFGLRHEILTSCAKTVSPFTSSRRRVLLLSAHCPSCSVSVRIKVSPFLHITSLTFLPARLR